MPSRNKLAQPRAGGNNNNNKSQAEPAGGARRPPLVVPVLFIRQGQQPTAAAASAARSGGEDPAPPYEHCARMRRLNVPVIAIIVKDLKKQQNGEGKGPGKANGGAQKDHVDINIAKRPNEGPAPPGMSSKTSGLHASGPSSWSPWLPWWPLLYSSLAAPGEVAASSLFVMFALGFGPLPWLLAAELIPDEEKRCAAGLAGCVNWDAMFLILQSFILLSGTAGNQVAFLFFSVSSFTVSIFISLGLPETNKMTTGEIQNILNWDHEEE